MGQLEIEERNVVENFGELCRNSDFFTFIESSNFPIEEDKTKFEKYRKP